jgi:hypothetical protein
MAKFNNIIKSREFFLIFIFGLSVFLLPGLAKGACLISCGNCPASSGSCQWSALTDVNTAPPFRVERLGIVGSVPRNASCPNDWNNPSICSAPSGSCKPEGFVPGGYDGQNCTALDGCVGFGCDYISQSGNWDASESKCVICNGNKEGTVLGDAGAVYWGCGSSGIPGNGKCETACGAPSCDDKSPGESCGSGGVCQADCTCVEPTQCVSGICCDTATGKFKTAGTLCGYSAFNGCNGDCQKTRDVYKCSGASANCPAIDQGDDLASVGNGKICSAGNEVSPSVSNYCSIANSCADGTCSGHKYYRSCDGMGFCRSDNNSAYDQTVFADSGFTLTSGCGTQGNSFCATNQCGEPGLPGFKCSMRCDASHACASPGTCTSHCGDGILNCGETGVDSGGSCASCTGSLNISSSGAGTCTVSGSMGASACAGQPWEIRDSSGAVKCSGTIIGSSYSNTCANWAVGLGTFTYRLFIGGVQKDGDKQITCTNAAFDFSISTNPVSGLVNPGGSISATVNTVLISGTTETVDFSASISGGWPAGMSADFSPASCDPTCSSVMTINTSPGTPLGTYSVNVCGLQSCSLCQRCTIYGVTVSASGVAISPPAVSTAAATNFTQTSATLNGTLDNMGGAGSCLVWFEWGPTNSYGNSTPYQTMNTTGAFSADITGLTQGTNYYFKAHAKNGGSW